MILDARQLEPGTRLEADLCIVGTGPAGLSLAREFLGTGLRVILLEAGGLEETAASQDFYAGESTGIAYDLRGSRYRMFGGSSAHWGGYTAPLEPADLEERPWVPRSGWPLSWEELQPFYPRAMRILGFAPEEFTLAHWTARGHEAVQFPAGTVRNKVWRFHRLRFGEAFRGTCERAAELRVLLHAPVTRIRCDAGRSRVEALEARPTPATSITVSARRYVLACGGLENPRLLLTGGPELGPVVENPRLGRCFMEHFHLTWSMDLALFTGAGASRLYQQCGVIDDCCEVRAFFLLAPELRRRLGLSNVAIKVHHEAEAGPVATAASRLDSRLRRRRHACHPSSLSIMAEQAPDPDCGLSLSRERDALGIPRLSLHWRANALDSRSAHETVRQLARALGRAGAGRIRPRAKVRALARSDDFGGAAHGGQHHMGTTRMAATPRDGVVDAQCRVHGLRNLYVAGSSVFPTGGSANPTLTIMALAIRLADHLAAELRG